MQFNEKLAFLMDITKTTNRALSDYVSLDASYISRLRSGKRLLPRDVNSVNGMAAYFAQNCREGYQKKAIGDILGVNPFPNDIQLLTKAIDRWLLNDKDGGRESIGQFLDSFSEMKGRGVLEVSPHSMETPFSREDTAVYYGVEGKRQAVQYFLSEVITLEKPQTLLLFSDEETSWMSGDPTFAGQWAALMFKTLARGHRIKIIHTISRDLDEMLSAIGQWMPLYMAGNIEPFFYPKKRDGIFKRTLFISPGTAAVVSSSIGEQTANNANVLFRNPAAVASYEEEFEQYLHLCRPLMRIFNAKDTDACFSTLAEFEKERCSTLIKTESLSLMTMPEELLSQILRRNGLEDTKFVEHYRLRVRRFCQSIDTNSFTEIITLPDPQAVIGGQIKLALSDMLDGGAVYYTPEEYRQHIENIVSLLNSDKNYHVQLIDGQTDERYAVYVKEELGVIVAKTSQPPVVLAMSESNMTAAFWDFLKTMVSASTYEHKDNRETSIKLSAYIDQLNQQRM